MRYLAAATLLIGLISLNGSAHADSDDELWIAQCVKDNASSDVKEVTLLKYCDCMNDEMDDDDEMSISEWELSHPNEKRACRKKAKWGVQASPPDSLPPSDGGRG